MHWTEIVRTSSEAIHSAMQNATTPLALASVFDSHVMSPFTSAINISRELVNERIGLSEFENLSMLTTVGWTMTILLCILGYYVLQSREEDIRKHSIAIERRTEGTAEARISNLQDRLEDRTGELERTTLLATRNDSKYKHLKGNLSMIRKDVVRSDRKIRQLLSKMHDGKEQSIDSKSKIQELEWQNQTANEKLSERDSTLGDLKDELSDTTTKVQEVESALQIAQDALAVKAKNESKLQDDKTRLEQEKGAALDEASKEKQARQELESQMSSLQDQLQQNKDELEDVSDELGGERLEYSTLKVEKQRLEQEIQRIREKAIRDRKALERTHEESTRGLIEQVQALGQALSNAFNQSSPTSTAGSVQSRYPNSNFAGTGRSQSDPGLLSGNLLDILSAMRAGEGVNELSTPRHSTLALEARHDSIASTMNPLSATFQPRRNTEPPKVRDINNEVCYYQKHDEVTGKRFPCTLHDLKLCVGEPSMYFTNGQYFLDLENDPPGTHYFGIMEDPYLDIENPRPNAAANDDSHRRTLAKRMRVCRWCLNQYDPNVKALPPDARVHYSEKRRLSQALENYETTGRWHWREGQEVPKEWKAVSGAPNGN